MSIRRKNDCDLPSVVSFCAPCRVNGWHGGDMSHKFALSLSKRVDGIADNEFAIGLVPKLCAYTSFACGLMSKEPTTDVFCFLSFDRARNKL